MKENTDWQHEYNTLLNNVKNYQDAVSRLTDWMHEHLMQLADEQKQEYSELYSTVENAETWLC